MSQVIIAGDTSGTITLQAPAVSGSTTLTLPAVTGTVMVSGNMPAFSAYASATQAVASATTTKIVYDTEVFDTNSNFASNRFTPTVAGYYQVSSGLFLPGSAAGGAVLYLYKNGGEYAQFSRLNMSPSLNIMGSGSILVYLNGSSDYVEMYVNQNSGSTLNVGQGTQAGCWFTGAMVRSA